MLTQFPREQPLQHLFVVRFWPLQEKFCQGAEDRPAWQTPAGRPRMGPSFSWVLWRQSQPDRLRAAPWAAEQPPLREARRGLCMPI